MASDPPPPTVARYDSPLFLIVCKDGPGAAGPRASLLDGHLAHVEANWRRYVLAGPLRNPGEGPLIGSYFLVRAKDADDARTLMTGDPYVSSGMYGSMEVLEATASIGRYLGGKIWESADAIRDRAAG